MVVHPHGPAMQEHVTCTAHREHVTCTARRTGVLYVSAELAQECIKRDVAQHQQYGVGRGRIFKE